MLMPTLLMVVMVGEQCLLKHGVYSRLYKSSAKEWASVAHGGADDYFHRVVGNLTVERSETLLRVARKLSISGMLHQSKKKCILYIYMCVIGRRAPGLARREASAGRRRDVDGPAGVSLPAVVRARRLG